MSAKINIIGIVTGHIKTLNDSINDKVLFLDVITFYVLPFTVSIVAVYFGFKASQDFLGLLVNFGSIFTALLLSVLVLVFDKEANVDQLPQSDTKKIKKRLLNQLYFNISYTIILSMVVVMLSLFHQLIWSDIKDVVSWKYIMANYIFTPILLSLVVNAFLTILMIVKRMHTMLVTP